jgi:hypothetical protein
VRALLAVLVEHLVDPQPGSRRDPGRRQPSTATLVPLSRPAEP